VVRLTTVAICRRPIDSFPPFHVFSFLALFAPSTTPVCFFVVHTVTLSRSLLPVFSFGTSSGTVPLLTEAFFFNSLTFLTALSWPASPLPVSRHPCPDSFMPTFLWNSQDLRTKDSRAENEGACDVFFFSTDDPLIPTSPPRRVPPPPPTPPRSVRPRSRMKLALPLTFKVDFPFKPGNFQGPAGAWIVRVATFSRVIVGQSLLFVGSPFSNYPVCNNAFMFEQFVFFG